MSEKSKDFFRPFSELPSPEDGGSLFEYPALARLFDKNEPDRLKSLRRSLLDATRALDHVVRTGAAEDAERASKVLAAIVVVIEFLDSVEAAADI